MDRDRELDEIEKALRGTPQPVVHKPDNLPISDGTTCFINQERMCASDCRAFNTNAKPGEGADCCLILASILDVGEKMEGVVALSRLLKKQQADAVRTGASTGTIPDPRGGKKTG